MPPDTARRQYLGAISERDFQSTVIEIARYHGYRVMHHLVSKGTEPGWVDLVLAKEAKGDRPADVLFRELKTATGKVTAAQGFWLNVLKQSGADAAVWRPSDLGEIVERLKRGRP